jgi:hypothetical protein
MKITQQDQRALIIEDFPYLIGAIAFPAPLFLLYEAIATGVRGGPTRDVIGGVFGALMFFFGGAIFTKRSFFEFDLVNRQLRWKRGGLFSRHHGLVPFDLIRRATVQSLGAGDTPTYRVAMLTKEGEIPLTDAYSSGIEAPDRIRTAINNILNAAPPNEMENDIQEMALAGREIDAIRLARERYGYDLTQAKEFVEGLLR